MKIVQKAAARRHIRRVAM